MGDILERFRLGLEGMSWRGFYDSMQNDPYFWIAIVFLAHALLVLAVVFWLGRRLYKQGRWQANRWKIVTGALLMTAVIGIFPVTVYLDGNQELIAKRQREQRTLAEPLLRATERESALAEFKQRVQAYTANPRSYFTPPPQHLVQGAPQPVIVITRDINDPVEQQQLPSNRRSTTLTTEFSVGGRQFWLREHITAGRKFSYTVCTQGGSQCAHSTPLGEMRCGSSSSEYVCEIPLGEHHYLTLATDSSWEKLAFYPSDVMPQLVAVPHEQLPLIAGFSYCKRQYAYCSDPYDEFFTQSMVE